LDAEAILTAEQYLSPAAGTFVAMSERNTHNSYSSTKIKPFLRSERNSLKKPLLGVIENRHSYTKVFCFPIVFLKEENSLDTIGLQPIIGDVQSP